MKYVINDIKEYIKNNHKIYWFKITSSKNILLSKGNTKKETKIQLNDKIKKNTKKYEDNIIYRIILKSHNEKKSLNHGSISLNLSSYIIKNGKIKKEDSYGKVGIIWFQEKWLIYNGWDKQYIINIINLIKTNKRKIITPGINYYPI